MDTFPNAVLGYRYFLVSDDGGLSPVAVSGAWPGSVAQAWCQQGRTHLVPDPDCDCGLYACYTEESLTETIGKQGRRTVVAVVAGSGRTQTHRDGFRAEKMQILQLLGSGDLIERAAARYRVPCGERLLPLPDSVQTMPVEHQRLSEEQIKKLSEETKEWSWLKEQASGFRGRIRYPAIHRERSAYDRWMIQRTEGLLFGICLIMLLVVVPSAITGELTHKIVPLGVIGAFICVIMAMNFIIRLSTVYKIRKRLQEEQ